MLVYHFFFSLYIFFNKSTKVPPIQIKSFKRYVDDSHARFKNVSESERFLKIFNQQLENIKCTKERENENKSLNFLDVNIKNRYKRSTLNKLTKDYHVKTNPKHNQTNENNEANPENTSVLQKTTITLPWIPEISNKLRKCFKSVGVRVIFKSGSNFKKNY